MAAGQLIQTQSLLLGSQLSEPGRQWGDQGAPRGWGRGRPKTCQGQQRERRPRFSCQVSQTNVPAWLVPTPAHLCHRRPQVARALSASSRMWRGHLRRVGVCGQGGGEDRLPWQKNPSLSMSF